MSTSPIAGGASSPLINPEDPFDAGAQTSTPSGTSSSSYLDLGFLQVTGSPLGIAGPAAAGGDTSVLVAEVLAENEKLRLENANAKNVSLSGRIQTAIAGNAAAAAQLARLEAEVVAIENGRNDVETQRENLLTSRDAKQSALNTVNAQISAKQGLINAQNTLIQQIDAALAALDDEEGADVTAREALQTQIDRLGARLVQLEAGLTGLEAAAAPDAQQSLQAIADAVDGSLMQLHADLATLGGGDAAVRAGLEAQIGLLSALSPELRTVLDDLAPDAEAGAARTLEGFSEALGKAIAALEEDIGDLSSSETADAPETKGSIAALQSQIAALGALAEQVDARRDALADSGEGDEPPADPGAAEGLRIVPNLLFGITSSIEGQIAASARREHGADRSLERSIDNLNAAIAALETERDGLDEEATQADIAAYAADIAALHDLVALLQADRAALPDTTGLPADEAFQAEIDALTAVSDNLSQVLRDNEASGRIDDIVASNVAQLIAASVTQLTQDVRDLEDAVLLAEREGTLTGRSATVSALNGLIAPLNSQVAAFTDGSAAAARAELAGQIAALADDIAFLQSQLDALDPEDDAAARTLLESQRASAIALKNSATAELNTLNGQKPPIEAQIGSLNSQINALDQAIAQYNAQIAVKNGEFDAILRENPQATVSAEEAAQAQRLVKVATLFASLVESILDDLAAELDRNRRAAARPVLWALAPEERLAQNQEGEVKRVPSGYGKVKSQDDARREAERLALPVVAVYEALNQLKAGMPDQPEPKRRKLAL
ncbi:hypothetical protein ACUSIJ_07540 [Pseudochelatococcus sp. B33]